MMMRQKAVLLLSLALIHRGGVRATLSLCREDCSKPEREGWCPVRFAPTQVFRGVDGDAFGLEYRTLTFDPCPGSNNTRKQTQWHEETGQGWTVRGTQIEKVGGILPDSSLTTSVVTLPDGSTASEAVNWQDFAFTDKEVLTIDFAGYNMTEFTFYGAAYRSVIVQEIGSVSFQDVLGEEVKPQLEFLDVDFWPRHAICGLCAPSWANESWFATTVSYAALGRGTSEERFVFTFRGTREGRPHGTASPTVSPEPTAFMPTPRPSPTPTPGPTPVPTDFMPTTEPSAGPTPKPTAVPSAGPTFEPTDFMPTSGPTPVPTTPEPSAAPTLEPTDASRRRLTHTEKYSYEIALFTKTGAIRMSWLEVELGNYTAVVGLSHGRVPEWKAMAYNSLNFDREAVGCLANRLNCSVETDIRPIGRTQPGAPYHRDPRGQAIAPHEMPLITRPHPWKIASSLANPSFCEFGCSQYYKNWTMAGCDAACDYYYRHETTAGYSDRAEQARYECRDGCALGQYRCQPGFYCSAETEKMDLCPTGKYRDFDYYHVTACDDCPHGRYRETTGGRYIDSCEKCNLGRYNPNTGSSTKFDCIACPPGRFANEKGMQQCKCIDHSGDFEFSPNGTVLYADCNAEMLQDLLREDIASIDYSPRTTYP